LAGQVVGTDDGNPPFLVVQQVARSNPPLAIKLLRFARCPGQDRHEAIPKHHFIFVSRRFISSLLVAESGSIRPPAVSD
jgi:hypothetical protein